ncbi:helicase-associated domain-containing protein [Arthrobacter sp. HLT1-20]
MGTLADLATELAHRSDEQLLRLFTLRPDAINPPVATFAALATRLCGPGSILTALDALNAPQLHALTALHSPAAAGTEAAQAALAQLHELALLTAVSPDPADDAGTPQFLPLASVGLVLGESPGSPAHPAATVPHPEVHDVRTALRNNAAASAAESLLRNIAELVESMGHTPLQALRDGGAGVRTVRRLAAWLELDEAQLCFYLDLAATAHLVSFDRASRQWRASAPDWPLLARPAQWLVLAQAWQGSNRLPFSGALGTPAANSPAAKPLAASSALPHLAALRRRVLGALAAPELAMPGRNPESPNMSYAPTLASVVAQLDWRHPRQAPAVSALVPGILAELELLGLTGAGALSIPGRCAAAADWPAALTALASTLPAPLDHFVIQGDLTVVAPGFLAPTIAAELKLLATAEGRGTAGIFRISEESLRNAVAAGRSHEDILGFLRRHCSTGLPQSLEYLIDATARHPASTAPPESPGSPEPPGGTPQRGPRRTPSPPREAPRPADDAVHVLMRAQLAQLRNNPVWGTAEAGEAGPALVMELLRQSIAGGSSVWLSAVNGSGDGERVLLVPLSLEGGLLRARLHGTGHERHFSIHRITAAEHSNRGEAQG